MSNIEHLSTRALDAAIPAALPEVFSAWFRQRQWQLRSHQKAVWSAVQAGEPAILLTAPTGGGKTLGGFLPSLIALSEQRADGAKPALHTVYISPLKALAVDIARNLTEPITAMALPVVVETRTGDTPPNRRRRQQDKPPDILLTTPEQLALLLSHEDAKPFFASLQVIIIDELHALADNKRGDLLALNLARLASLAPQSQRIGLSATVADPDQLGRFIGLGHPAHVITGEPGPKPQVRIVDTDVRVPWSGHLARHLTDDIYRAIQAKKTTLVFVNTRAQAEIAFQELWRINDANLAIALHHGSLAPEQRRKVEAAMVRGDLQAVVCTATLDLGIDWGAVDQVIQIGAPKGLSRLVQRIGRSNHRLDMPSEALLAPANRFEVLECQAAAEAVAVGELDGKAARQGGLDVLAQHILGTAVAAPFAPDQVFQEIRRATPYAHLSRATFDAVVEFVATGGYALRAYERYRRLHRDEHGHYHVISKAVARQYRMNVGTIVEAPMLKVRLRRGRELGQIEEAFIEQLSPGDTFAFAGHILRFEQIRDLSVIVTRATGRDPLVPSYYGGKFPLSTFLADRVRRMLADPDRHHTLPEQVQEWLRFQQWRSCLPRHDQVLVETFPRNGRYFLVAYPFEGRLAHQTLGMLMTRRMQRLGFKPMGFVASEYALAVWSLNPVTTIPLLFEEDMLGDDLEAWLQTSNLMKRTFRNVAIIAGLIERRHPGHEKSGRQVTFNADLIYNVLRSYEPDHVLLKATYQDAATGLLDIERLGGLLRRAQGHLLIRPLDRVSPLAVPLMLEIGRESVHGETSEMLLKDAADALIDEATRLV